MKGRHSKTNHQSDQRGTSRGPPSATSVLFRTLRERPSAKRRARAPLGRKALRKQQRQEAKQKKQQHYESHRQHKSAARNHAAVKEDESKHEPEDCEDDIASDDVIDEEEDEGENDHEEAAYSGDDDPDLTEMAYLEAKLGLGASATDKSRVKAERKMHQTLADEGLEECFDIADQILATKVSNEHPRPRAVPVQAEDDESGEGEASDSSAEEEQQQEAEPSAPGNSSKYVPPHLRSVQGKGEDTVGRVRTKVVGLVNRVSEGNLEPITVQLLRLLEPMRDEREAEGLAVIIPVLVDEILKSCLFHRFTTLYLLGVQTALITALHVTLHTEVGFRFFFHLMTSFQKYLRSFQKSLPSCGGGAGGDDVSMVAADGRKRKRRHGSSSAGMRRGGNGDSGMHECEDEHPDEGQVDIEVAKQRCKHSLVALCLLFDLGVLDPAIIQHLVHGLAALPHFWDTDFYVDLLLTVFRFTSGRFRSDHGGDFKALITHIKGLVETHLGSDGRGDAPLSWSEQLKAKLKQRTATKRHGAAAAAAPPAAMDEGKAESEGKGRLGFLLAELAALKTARATSKFTVAVKITTPLRNWFKTSKLFSSVRFDDYLITIPLPPLDPSNPPSLFALPLHQHNAHSTPTTATGAASSSSRPSKRKGDDGEGDGGTAALMEVAASHRLRSDLQKGLFVALMGSEDPVHACQRLQDVVLAYHRQNQTAQKKKQQQYEYVVAVVLHCCLHEKSFNLFYTRVLQHCCGLPGPIAKHYQRALTKGVSSQLSLVPSFAVRKTLNFAQMLATLVHEELLPLKLLRFLDLQGTEGNALTGNAGLFLKHVCLEMLSLCASDMSRAQALFGPVAAFPDVCEAVLLVLDTFVLPEVSGETSPLRKRGKGGPSGRASASAASRVECWMVQDLSRYLGDEQRRREEEREEAFFKGR